MNTSVCSGSIAQLVCSATDVTSVSYSLNSKSPLPPNVYISAPTYIGGATTVVNMSISNASANAVITCRAYLVNGTVLNRSAYITVQGQAFMNINLTLYIYVAAYIVQIFGASRAQQHCPCLPKVAIRKVQIFSEWLQNVQKTIDTRNETFIV